MCVLFFLREYDGCSISLIGLFGSIALLGTAFGLFSFNLNAPSGFSAVQLFCFFGRFPNLLDLF